jgi:hypothetical protein
LELLEYSTLSRKTVKPRSCDIGSSHLAFKIRKTEQLQGIIDKCAQFGYKVVGEVIDVKLPGYSNSKACYSELGCREAHLVTASTVRDEVDGHTIELVTEI